MKTLQIDTHIIVGLALALSSSATHADIRRVPAEYATIQGAINASFSGDVVEVGPGVYSESLNLGGRAITVRSTDGAATTVIDPTTGRCFTATGQKGPAARLEGFTLRGGSATQGGGVYVQSSSPTLANCVILGNISSGDGGGVYVSSGNPTLINCTIAANQSQQRGGGAFVESGSITLTDCSVTGNVVIGQSFPYAMGGGLYIQSASATITGGEVRGNTSVYGAGIYGGTLNITECSITSNVANQDGGSSGIGGGISSASVTINGGVVSNNTSNGTGGGLSDVTGQINNCVISGNTASSHGGAIYSSGSLTLSFCTVEENTAGGTGGAWYKQQGTAVVQSCTIRNNNALSIGGLRLVSGITTLLNSTLCGNGVNVSGTYVDAGGNTLLVDCEPFCIGDLSADGHVDAEDLSILLGAWGRCLTELCAADVTDDKVVDGSDLAALLVGWGSCD